MFPSWTSVNVHVFNPGCGLSLSLRIYPRQSLNVLVSPYCYKFVSKQLCKPWTRRGTCTVSYSYGAPHNAPAHKGQFCNAKFFSTYFLKNRILPRLSVIFDSRGQIKVITSSRCFLLKEAHPERAILFSDKLDSKFTAFTHQSESSYKRTNRSIWFDLWHIRGVWLTEEAHRNGADSGQSCTATPVASEICLTHNSWLNLELLVSKMPRSVHEGHS